MLNSQSKRIKIEFSYVLERIPIRTLGFCDGQNPVCDKLCTDKDYISLLGIFKYSLMTDSRR
jgi:hypothetical protein